MNNAQRFAAISLVFATLPAFAADAPPSPPPPPPMTAEECAVWQRELSFAQSVDRHDAKAFAEHLHPNALFSAGTAQPTRGADAVAKSWASTIEGKPLILRWRPQFVNIGVEADLAFSRGPYVVEDPRPDAKTRYRKGHFVSVWKKDPRSGVWHVLFDGGGAATGPVDAEEAAKHMAQAPASCNGK